MNSSPIGTCVLDRADDGSWQLVWANQAFADLLGCRVTELVGVTASELVTAADQGVAAELRHRLLTQPQRDDPEASAPIPAELAYRCRDGRALPVHVTSAWLRPPTEGRGGRVVDHVVDISGWAGLAEELASSAATDVVTGLPNRARLELDINTALRAVEPAGTRVGVVQVGVDRFKNINEHYGHTVGDELLELIAERLRQELGPAAVLGRLDGDEFLLVVRSCRAVSDLRSLASLVLRMMRRPFRTSDGLLLSVSASAGIVLSEPGDSRAEDLLRRAAMAVEAAKAAGYDRAVVYDAAMQRRADVALVTEQRLRHGLAADGLRLYLQPVVELATGEAVGAEALVRLDSGPGGVLGPADFIDVAEHQGLVPQVDRWVIQQSVELLLRDAAPWIAVNVSGHSLRRLDIAGRVVAALHEHDLPAGRLHIELTESTLLEEHSHVTRTVQALREYGCVVGIDDFGTGYSAMAYLQRFELDFLKIDRSFVKRLGEGERHDAVAAAIVALAHANGLSVTAEGIETPLQATILRDLGCDHAQGYWFGRPTQP